MWLSMYLSVYLCMYIWVSVLFVCVYVGLCFYSLSACVSVSVCLPGQRNKFTDFSLALRPADGERISVLFDSAMSVFERLWFSEIR